MKKLQIQGAFTPFRVFNAFGKSIFPHGDTGIYFPISFEHL